MPRRILIGAAAIAALAPFYALALPGDTVPPYFEWSDYVSLQLPAHEFIRDELRAGRVPLWIPWVGCGTPLHASQQAAVFYPGLTLPLILFTANDALKLCLLAHLALAYAGQYRLCRSLGASAPAASLAALVVAQCGFMVNHLMAGHVTMVVVAALVPWFLWALVRLLDSPGPGRAALAGAAGGAIAFACHPQIAYYALLLGAAWAAGWFAFAPRSAPRGRAAAWLGIAAVVAALTGAVQILPSAELVLDGHAVSQRGDQTFAVNFAFDALDLARLALPNLAGNPFVGSPQVSDGDFFHEHVAYLGLGAWALAGFGLSRVSARRWQWGAALLALFGLAIALGDSAPWFSLLGRVVPGMFWFRCPGRVFAIVTPLVGLLAARGFDAAISGERCVPVRRLWPFLALTLAAAAVLLPAFVGERAALAWGELFEHAWSTGRQELLAQALFAGNTLAGILLVVRAGQRRRGAIRENSGALQCALAGAALWGVAFGDLAYNNAANFWLEPARPERMPPEIAALDPPVRFVDAPRYPDLDAVYLSYSRLVETAVAARRSMVGVNDGGILPGALGRYFRAVERAPHRALAIGACDYATRRGGRWIALRGSLPRLRLVPSADGALVFTPIDELTLSQLNLLRKVAGTHRRAVAEAPNTDAPARRLEAPPAPPEAPDSLAPSIKTVHEDPQNLVLDVSTPQDVLLVVADLFYPGWQCAIDGQPTAIEAAHGVFRAVAVPHGTHRVEFHYRSAAFRWGAIGSIAGLIILTILAAIAKSNNKSKNVWHLTVA